MDSAAFSAWLVDFRACLIKGGVPTHVAAKYGSAQASGYFTSGKSAGDAALAELRVRATGPRSYE